MKKSKGAAIIAVIMACLLGLGYFSYLIIDATSQKKDNYAVKL